MIGEIRKILKGTQVWSIANQTLIGFNEDQICEVTHTCIGNDTVFVEPKRLAWNLPGQIPTLMGRGTDEWSVSYSKTEPYQVPKPQF